MTKKNYIPYYAGDTYSYLVLINDSATKPRKPCKLKGTKTKHQKKIMYDKSQKHMSNLQTDDAA